MQLHWNPSKKLCRNSEADIKTYMEMHSPENVGNNF